MISRIPNFASWILKPKHGKEPRFATTQLSGPADTILAMKPHGRNLRIGRHSEHGTYYFLTAVVARRRKIFFQAECAETVLDSIRWLDDTGRFLIDAAVVMPDHLHIAGCLRWKTLGNVMHSLKSFTSNRLPAQIERPIWQKGYHDHGLRDDKDYRRRVQYLLENPIRSGLVNRIEEYPFVILPDWWVVE